ncbi:hypothetical protein APHAL10511_008238 [Amanita phalloides]|nr:hypothetical protein APHAL10511_008238 [Amanita phalloides]
MSTKLNDSDKDWTQSQDLALYLLSQKLPDSILTKYMCKQTVAEMWSAIIAEFMQKSMLMKSNLHSEFMAMHYTKGANLREEFDHIHMKYEQLLNASITISDDDYHMLIINFVPAKISSFITQISANLKVLMSSQPVLATISITSMTTLSGVMLNTEMLMQMAVEEWECCLQEAHHYATF